MIGDLRSVLLHKLRLFSPFNTVETTSVRRPVPKGVCCNCHTGAPGVLMVASAFEGLARFQNITVESWEEVARLSSWSRDQSSE